MKRVSKLLERFLERTEFDSYEDFKANYRLKVPEDFNFGYDIVDGWAKQQPDKLALVWCDDCGNRRDYTFSDISELSDRAANYFLSLGLARGDRVLMILKQRPEAWITLVALCKIGVVCIPATYQLTEKDIVYRCNSAGVKAIVCISDDGVADHVRTCASECTSLQYVLFVGDHGIKDGEIDYRKEIQNAKRELLRPEINSSDPMLIYFSSGTTGMPKMIMHDFYYPLGHIVTAKYWQRVEDGKLHLTMSDSGWAKFAWGKIYGQWICGAVIVAYDNDKFDAHRTLEMLCRLRVYSFCAPPTIFRFLIKEDLSRYDLSFIKHASIAGEPLNPEVWKQFRDLTGLTLTEGFVQTETPVILANFPWFDIKPGSTGKPSPLFDIDIVDDDFNSCEDGVVGHIVVRNLDKFRPKGLVREYIGDVDANASAFRCGCYDTGDTAWRDSDGYYWFVGRSDDVIKCSGYRIGPFEVESALMTHPSVLECAVTAAPDPVRGQVVKATVVLVKGYEPTDAHKKVLQDHVKHVTAPYKYPRIVEFVDELPKTVSGKIKRSDIRRQTSEKGNA